jgi:L-ribulose-5-phosphate 4-epimerase
MANSKKIEDYATSSLIERARTDNAVATRLLVAESILDYAGHISARIPGRDAFVIQDGGTSRGEVEPESMLTVDYHGNVLEGSGQPPSELAIHLAILNARPDVAAVLHCHMELAIAFTMMEGVQLQPMRARATRWKTGIPIDPDPSHIKLPQQGEALAKTLGKHHAALMRAHGMVLVAENVQALFVDAIHFKENARALLEVLHAGAQPLALTPEEIVQIERMETRDWHVRKLWNYYTRKGFSTGVLPAAWKDTVVSGPLRR